MSSAMCDALNITRPQGSKLISSIVSSKKETGSQLIFHCHMKSPKKYSVASESSSNCQITEIFQRNFFVENAILFFGYRALFSLRDAGAKCQFGSKVDE